MLDHTLDAENSILIIRPRSSLSESDFAQLTQAVDPYITAGGALNGIIIEVPKFPGWKSLGAWPLISASFATTTVGKVALVTDSALGTVAEALASHFVSAEIKKFGSGELEAAKRWVLNRL